MVGAGAMVFAVWGYVIANSDESREWGTVVSLNPRLLGPILGESLKDVEKAIEYLCAPDPESQSKEQNGRRLIRIGQYEYQVVNGARYRKIRNEEDRREQLRVAQAKFREKQKGRVPKQTNKLPGEAAFVAAVERGDEEGAARIEEAEQRRLEEKLGKTPIVDEDHTADGPEGFV
jgi:hypothetical protein